LKVNQRYRIVRQSERLALRLPESLLRRIDEARYDYGQTRSEFIRGVLISYFREIMRPEIVEAPRPRLTSRPGL